MAARRPLLRAMLRFAVALALATTLAAPAGAADRVVVFAAASLKNALDDAAAAWTAATGHGVAISYAGSSALARQIQAGAPADVYLSANVAWMDALQAQGLIRAGSRADLLGNSLVLIAPRSGPAPKRTPMEVTPAFDLAGLLGDGRLAIALTDAVPAGMYGKAALQRLGLWRIARMHLAETDNARAALALVAAGEAPLGIVYATDARAEDRVAILARIPPDTHPEIVYPAAVVAESANPLAGDFFAYLQGPGATGILKAHGFLVRDRTDP